MSAAAVWIKERDLSLRVPSFDGVYNAIVIKAVKGQTDVPRLVTDEADLLRNFTPRGTIQVGWDNAYYSALAVLQKTNKLWVRRVVSGDSGYGMVKVAKAGTNPAFVQANLVQNEKPEITFDVSDIKDGSNEITISNIQGGASSDLVGRVINIVGFGSFEISEINAGVATLTQPIQGDNSFSGTGSAQAPASADYATMDLAGLADGDEYVDVSNYTSTDGSTVDDLVGKTITVNNSFDIEVQSVSGTTLTLTQALSAQSSDTATGFIGRPTSTFDVSGVVDGASQLETSSLQPAGVTLADLNGVDVDFTFNLSDGSVQAETIKMTYDGNASFINLETPINNAQVIDVSTGNAPFEAEQIDTVSNPEAQVFGPNDVFSLWSADQGSWSKDLRIQIITDPEKVKIANAFIIKIYFKDNLAQPVETFTLSRIDGTKDGFGRNIYIDDALKASKYIRGKNNPVIDGNILPGATADIVAYAQGVNYTSGSIVYDFASQNWYTTTVGGTSIGATVEKDSGVIWKLAKNAIVEIKGGDDGTLVTDSEMISAVSTFANKNSYPVTLLIDGGNAVPSFQKEMIKIVERRKDSMAILSCPIASELNDDYVNEIIKYRDFELNANTSYAALFTCHVEITDKYNDRKLYVAPDGYAAAAINYSAANFEIWYPPAGYKRGKLLVNDTLRRFKDGEMDIFYDKGINPIRFYPGKGIAIWGQKTLSATPSSLDRMNVRLLLIIIEPAIAEFLEDYLFDLNTDGTRRLIVAGINNYMEGIKAKNGVYDYYTVCDETNNAPGDIDNHILNVDVFVKPVQSIEYINFTTIITSSGVDFKLAAAAL